MGPYQRTPKEVARAIRFSGLGVRSVDPVGDFLDISSLVIFVPNKLHCKWKGTWWVAGHMLQLHAMSCQNTVGSLVESWRWTKAPFVRKISPWFDHFSHQQKNNMFFVCWAKNLCQQNRGTTLLSVEPKQSNLSNPRFEDKKRWEVPFPIFFRMKQSHLYSKSWEPETSHVLCFVGMGFFNGFYRYVFDPGAYRWREWMSSSISTQPKIHG